MKRVLLICAVTLLITSSVQAETRFFVPEFHVGAGTDTQLLMNNKEDVDATVDIWAFSRDGQLVGQAQLGLKARATKSFTVSELFGSDHATTGWLAVFSSTNSSEMSYRLIGMGSQSEAQEAETVPSRQAMLDTASGQVLRISNPSSIRNTVTARKVDENGSFAGLQEVSIEPFGQAELALDSSNQRLELSGTGEFLSFIGEKHPEVVEHAKENSGRDSRVALIIDSEVPLGAFQVLLQFDPKVLTFSSDDIDGGTAEGFDSKPLAIGIDNAAGEIRIASFQVGNHPVGQIDVAHLRLRASGNTPAGFGLRVEEVTDLRGESILRNRPTIRLTRLP